jgi:serine/threonine-protein kinase
LIFLLTGRNPADFIELTPDGYRFNLSSIPSIPPQLQAFITKITQRRPRDRYQTAAEAIAALQAIGGK